LYLRSTISEKGQHGHSMRSALADTAAVIVEVSTVGDFIWPSSTAPDEVREFTFTVKTRIWGSHENTELLRLKYIDSAGELLIDPQAPSPAQETPSGHIESANVLVGVIDGYHVRQHLLGDPQGWANLERSLDALVSLIAP
jgi:hypothetical protein